MAPAELAALPRAERRRIQRRQRRLLSCAGGAELVSAHIGPRRNPILSESGQRRELWRRVGADPERDPAVRELLSRDQPPISGGATGVQGAAFMHNLPPEGEYVMNSDLFFQETERNDVPQQVAAFTGLGGGAIDQRVSNVGVLAKIRMVFTGSLVIAGGGTATATYQWPWNVIKRFTLNANGQTSLVSCEGMDLRARRQRFYRNPRDPITVSPGIDTGGAAVGDPAGGVIANGTYPITLVYDVPIVHDDYTLTGGLFAQSDQIYLSWRAVPASTADLFTLAGGSTAVLTGSIASTLTFYDIPFYDDPKAGRKVLIPDLQWLHGYLSSDSFFSNLGDVKTPFIRTAGQLLSYSAYIDNGGAAVVDPTALTELRFEYGGNRRPRVYNPPATLLEKNAADYNGRILPKAGYVVLDFEVDNPRRDLVYPKGVTELLLAANIPAGVTLNANSHVHFIEETLFAGA